MIREATLDDIPAIMEMGRSMAQESPRFARLEWSERKVAKLLRTMILAPAALVLVADEGGAFFLGIATEHWMSTDKVAADYAIYVSPERRGSALASAMIDRYKAWAIEQGAKVITLGISTGVHPERTAVLFERKGFTRCAVTFEVENVHGS